MYSSKILFGLAGLCMVTTNLHAEIRTINFNPAISFILDGRFNRYSNKTDYQLPGFMLGGEASRGEQGLHLGHNELSMSANIDDLFYGKLTAAIADHEAETQVELEEAFIGTRGLGYGLSVKAGRFFSDIGYLNNQHAHVWDFTDAPLIYRGLFGNQIKDDGLQITWLAPTEFYLKVGVEVMRGSLYPAAGASRDGQGARSLFLKFGGDVGTNHAWQLGLSHWNADIAGRQAGSHAHDAVTEIPTFTGSSDVNGIDIVWKWSPHGNSSERYLKIQAEYFTRDETGNVNMVGSSPLETTTYSGEQSGWYTQAVYQFIPRWRIGFRYDRLQAANNGSDTDVLTEAGLTTNGHSPSRSTLMLDYSRSEFSRIRLQYAQDDSYQDADNIFTVQYTMALGAHGAHKF